LLPAIFSITGVHRQFCEKYKEHKNLTEDPISLSCFRQFYYSKFPYLKKLGKRTDFCDVCCKLKTTIKDKKSSEENKTQAKISLEKHTILFTEARKAYSDHRRKTAQENGYYVLSMDYAENILLSNLLDEPGTFYFKTRRKVDIFGINNENTNEQLNFIIDECFKIKKGPDSVISMLDHYIETYIPTGSSLILYADNCCGQNKNQFLIGYLSYLVKIKKKLKHVELYFMIVGHTKFSPDSHFGLIKQRLKISVCESILDVIGENGIIRKSSKNNFCIAYKDPFLETVNFNWRDWKNSQEYVIDTLLESIQKVQIF